MTRHQFDPEALPIGPSPKPPLRPISTLDVTFTATAGQTHAARIHEAGALRLRQPRHAGGCEGVILNTGGGVLGGDRLRLRFDVGTRADAVLTTVAAEKIYKSEAEPATIDTTLALASGSRLDWLPQETILFDRARLLRSLHVTMAGDATLLAAEMLVFGRLAMGETAISASLRDRWRVRRDGRLVFADETRLDGPLPAILDRPALGGVARAAALVLSVAPDAEHRLDPLRAALEPFDAVTAGASAFDGILVARLLARSPELLRTAMVAALRALRGRPLPRVWQ